MGCLLGYFVALSPDLPLQLIDAVSTKMRIIVAAIVTLFDFCCFQLSYIPQNFLYG